jgi:hypothetical protein
MVTLLRDCRPLICIPDSKPPMPGLTHSFLMCVLPDSHYCQKMELISFLEVKMKIYRGKDINLQSLVMEVAFLEHLPYFWKTMKQNTLQ